MRFLQIFLLGSFLIARLHAGAGWQAWLSPELRHLERERLDAVAELNSMGEPMVGQTTIEIGYQATRWRWEPPRPHWIQIDLGEQVAIDTVSLFPVLLHWRPGDKSAYAFPVRFRLDVSDDGKFEVFQPIGGFTDSDVPEHGISPVSIRTGPVRCRYVRLTVTKLAKEEGRYFFSLSEIAVLSGNRNVALNRAVTSSSSVEVPPRWSARNLVDGRTALNPPIKREPPPEDGIFAGPAKDVPEPWMQFEWPRPMPVDEIRLHPVHSRLGGDLPGYLFPKHLKVEILTNANLAHSKVLFDSADYTNPGNNPVTIRGRGVGAQYLRITAVKCDGPTARFGFSEIQVYSGNSNIAGMATITRTPDIKQAWSYRWPVDCLTDGYTSYGRLLELPEWLCSWDRRRELQGRLARIADREIKLRLQSQTRAGAIGTALAAAMLLGGCLAVVKTRQRRNRDLEDLRARLARDIHDEIGSNLAGITVLSEMRAETASAERGQQEDWREVHRISRETMDAMREVLWLVGGKDRADLNLMIHLKLAASRMLADKEVEWRTDVEHLLEALPGEAKRHIFLFFKEALNNIARHSRATRVEISFTLSDNRMVLQIADNGCGFETARAKKGIGLGSQEKRARALGASASIRSAPASGTVVRLEVPPPRNRNRPSLTSGTQELTI